MKIVELELKDLHIPSYILDSQPEWVEEFREKLVEWTYHSPRRFFELCIDFGINRVYKDDPEIKRLLLRIKRGRATESWKHKKEKAKLLCFLLDSGINPSAIYLEHRIPALGFISDIAVKLISFNVDLFPVQIDYLSKIEFQYFLACEVGTLSKSPEDYTNNGIPLIWVPYRKDLKKVLKVIEQKPLKSYFIKYYAHLFDESLFGFLITPEGGSIR